MPRILSWILLCLALCTGTLMASSAAAPPHLMIGSGLFNIVRTQKEWMVQGEYRWEPHYHHIRPLLSLMVTRRGSVYICGGAGLDIFLGKRVVLTPSFAPGLYFKGKGKDLHFPLEFRSSIELAWITKNKGRLGAQFYHISNASLARKNPGAEILTLFYAIPL